MTELLPILQGLFEANGIRVQFLPADACNKNNISQRNTGSIVDNAMALSGALLYDRILSHTDPGILYYYRDAFLLTYAIYRFRPEDSYPDHLLLVGPLVFQRMGEAEVEAFLAVSQLPNTEEVRNSISAFYRQIPLSASYDRLNNTLSYFLSKMCVQSPRSMHVTSERIDLFQSDYREYRFEEGEQDARDALEERYHLEAKMLKAVKAGDVKHAHLLYKEFRKAGMSQRVADALRNRKNMALIFNTILRKAVEEAGVHPLHIDTLSRQLHSEIESCNTVNELDTLSETMIDGYCFLVERYARNDHSALIKDCLNFIDFHYSEEVTLHRLAKEHFVTDSYLSAQFAKETGRTLIGYLNDVRLQQSLVLLHTTDLSIRDIAGRCGFSSYNYYSRVFRNVHQVSPQAYRKQFREAAVKQKEHS